jgi:hypothetical protein
MKKIKVNIALLLGFLLFSSTIFSQDLKQMKITWGEEINVNKGDIVEIVGDNDRYVYSLAVKGKKYFLKIFDSKKLAMTSMVEIELPEVNNKDVELEQIIMLNNQLFAVGSVFDNKAKKFNLVASKLSVKGVLDKNYITLFSTPVEKKKHKGSFAFSYSPDHLKMMVMLVSDLRKEKAYQYEAKVINAEGKVLGSARQKIVYGEDKKEKAQVIDFTTNNNGDMFIAVNRTKYDRKTKTLSEKFGIAVMKKANNYKLERIAFNFKGNYAINANLIHMEDGEHVGVVGYYAGTRKNGKASYETEGVYLAKVNINSNSLEKIKFNPFTTETKTKIIGIKKAEKGRELPPNYRIRSIVKDNEGGVIIVGEYYSFHVKTTTSNGKTTTTYTWVYDDVIVSSFDKDGNENWTNVIPKEQRFSKSTSSVSFGIGGPSLLVTASIPYSLKTQKNVYLGIVCAVHDENIYVIFNDHPKNVGMTEADDFKRLNNPHKGLTTAFVVNFSGKMKRIDTEEAAANEVVIRPGISNQVESNELLIYASKRKKDKVGRIIFGESKRNIVTSK